MEWTSELKKNVTKALNKQNDVDLLDLTILSTLQPQASSTVERKTYVNRLQNHFMLPNNPLLNNNDDEETKDSSLGLVNNISNLLDDDKDNNYINLQSKIQSAIMQNIETEKQLARELLLRCSQAEKNADTNKENNGNIQNLVYNQIKDSNSTVTATHNSTHNSVVFEPTEFTARSSEMINNKSRLSSTRNNIPSFSFNTTAGEFASKFGEADFMSGSGMLNKLDADEMSWRQNFGAIPIASGEHSTSVAANRTNINEQNRLDLTCFSGIIGDLDLTIKSTATGRRVSVGEYFERKCDALGQLSKGNDSERPNFGLKQIISPERMTRAHALVNPAEITNEAVETNDTMVSKTDDDYADLLSISKIAQVLQSANESPRQLLDILLKQNNKKKNDYTKTASMIDATAGTYTVFSARSSLPVISSSTLDVDRNEFSKLSLNHVSQMKNDSAVGDVTLKPQSANNSNRKSLELSKTSSDLLSNIINIKSSPKSPSVSSKSDIDKVKMVKESVSRISFDDRKESFDLPKISVSSNIKTSPKSPSPMSSYSKNVDYQKIIKQSESEPSSPLPSKLKLFYAKTDLNCTKIKEELVSSSFYSRFNDKISIGNTQDLYKCIVGTPAEASIEIKNDSVKWILCTCKLHQIQGNQDNVEIEVPSDQILIEPNKSNAAKISVNFLKAGDPIMAALVIEIMDMTSREKFTKQHMMCFIPEKSTLHEVMHDKDDSCEIDLVDTPIPIILEKNENKFLSLKNISGQIINLTASIVQSDKTQILFTIEPKEIILHCNEVGSLMISYYGSDAITLRDKQAIIKVRTNKNTIYSYPLIGRDRQLSDENIDDLRCTTPQQVGAVVSSSVPLSPQSTTSSNKFERNSPRSSVSASSTVADDSIPIKTNHSALVWTTVRVGKHETREFTIRNTSNNKIKLQGIITDNDNSFKFLKDRDMSTTITISLQHMERKTFTVSCQPNNTGPVAGKITFFHYGKKYDNKYESRPSKIIPLYGYGGHAKVCISQALKIMGDQRWLSLGKLNPNGTLNTKMKVENNGDLPAYVKISLIPKAVYPFVEKSWNVEPTELILGPKEVHWITIKFRPRREDIALVRSSDGSDMGTLTITHGDEPTRWRIRRLYNKMLKEGQIKKKQEENNFKNVVYPLCKVFPGERSISNLNVLRDSINDLETLCRKINRFVITLIMESNADDTSIFVDDDDESNESRLFQSLCSDMSNTIIGASEDSYMPLETLTENQDYVQNGEPGFIVSPVAVTLTPPSIKESTVMIRNKLSTAQPFETRLTNNNEYLSVVPSQGMIPANRGILLNIRCKQIIDRNVNALLEIYTANEKQNVTIQVLHNRRH